MREGEGRQRGGNRGEKGQYKQDTKRRKGKERGNGRGGKGRGILPHSY